ncbi:MAG: signal peptide peptidase SppA [Victivallales bacterium]
MKTFFKALAPLVIAVIAAGCMNANFKLMTDSRDPMLERTISGTGDEKVLMISVTGIISDIPEYSLFLTKPSMLEEFVSQLNLAAKDPDIKAVVIKINSPGGSVTASDIIYNEILNFKEKSKAKVVAVMMDVAASGGYYIALPADEIIAHPTSLTGSVGVIFMRPEISGLMGKIGVGFEVNKSGRNKDMGSPFRKPTKEEETLFNNLISGLSQRFNTLVLKHRKISPENMKEVMTARIFIAPEAMKLGMIDKTGYLDDAVKDAKKLADIPENSKVIAYRRSFYPNDNLYNGTTSKSDSPISLINLGPLEQFKNINPGLYYLWLPAAGQ